MSLRDDSRISSRLQRHGRRNALHTGHVISSACALHTECARLVGNRGGYIVFLFYFLTNPSLLIKWRLENNLTSLMSGHEFYCYCILINFHCFNLSMGLLICFRVFRKETYLCYCLLKRFKSVYWIWIMDYVTLGH